MEATKQRWAKAPPIEKNFYVEDPMVAAMHPDDVKQYRYAFIIWSFQWKFIPSTMTNNHHDSYQYHMHLFDKNFIIFVSYS